MRIIFRTLTVPKKAAKRVQKYFSPEPTPSSGMKLSEAQEVTAVMLGYESWHELSQVTKAGTLRPSALDEECSAEEQERRLDFQTEALGRFSPLIDLVRRRVAQQLRVSAANPNSSVLIEQSYSRNSLVFWTDPFSGESEWRFFPSERSEEMQESFAIEFESWMGGSFDGTDLYLRLCGCFETQPENLIAAELLFALAEESGQPSMVDDLLDKFEAAVMQTIPEHFPASGPVKFEWYTHTNRILHKVTYSLAEGYYRTGNFPKAKRWFEFTSRTSKRMRPHCLDFLKGLKRPVPGGRVHLR